MAWTNLKNASRENEVMFCEILPLLTENTLTLTANRRLALRLTQQFDQSKIKQNQKVWRSPEIMPLQTWLALCWKKYGDATLLNPLQEQLLWQKIIDEDAALANLAASAWQTLQLWNIPLEQLHDSHNNEVEHFLNWALEFQQQCQQNHWLTHAELPQQLLKLVERNALTIPQHICLVGFDELAPGVEQLAKALEQKTDVHYFNTDDHKGQSYLTLCKDTETEILAMARYAKMQLDHNPHAHIGCIVPNLSQLRSTIERNFNEIFPDPALFNISAGQILSQYPILQSALQILSLSQATIKTHELMHLLQSPYLAKHSDDLAIGALADVAARELDEVEISLETLLPLFTRLHALQPESTWLKRWQTLLHWQQNKPKEATPIEWIQQWTELLTLMGWPGQRDINSVEYQLILRWKKLLLEFTCISTIHPTLKQTEALRYLRHIAAQNTFQAEGSNGNVQILGLLEAGGNQFDAMWVMGLHNEAWPPAAKPNPFIPYPLQKKHHMPHATATRELHYTQQTLQRLEHSAKTIIFSAPTHEGDKELQPSPLIAHYERMTFPELDNIITTTTQQFNTATLESFHDDFGPQISTTEKIRGGSWILKLQSACPFQAFATIRLKATSIPTPSIGISAKLRGTLAHEALDRIWKKLTSQRVLAEKSDKELEDLVQDTVEKTLASFHKSHQTTATQHFLKIEQQRLKTMLMDWLQYEKTRPPFTVSEHESQRQITLGQLNLNLKIDRIDTLENGEQVIIDYKTGAANTSAWFGERPNDPQLPLYCCYGNQDQPPYAGVTFAELKPGNLKLRGVWNEASAKNMPEFAYIKSAPDWTAITTAWQQTLTELSNDFCNGKATVDPNETSTCQLCDLKSFCRINWNS